MPGPLYRSGFGVSPCNRKHVIRHRISRVSIKNAFVFAQREQTVVQDDLTESYAKERRNGFGVLKRGEIQWDRSFQSMWGFLKMSSGKGESFTLLSGSNPFQGELWREGLIWMEMDREILQDMAESIVP